MKSIRMRILFNMIITVAVSLIVVGVVCIYLNYNNTQNLLKETMTETAVLASESISNELQSFINVAAETGSIARLTSADVSLADKKAMMDQKVSTYGFERGNIIGADGKSIFDGKDFSDQTYFQAAMEGKTYVSEPLLSKVTGEIATIVAAPLWKAGKPGTEPVGAVYFAPKASFLNDMVSKIKVSENGSAYIIDKDGYTIAHVDSKRVEERENVEEIAKSTPALEGLAKVHSEMRAQTNGFGKYSFSGVEKFIAYSPIADSNGWVIGVNAPISDFMGSTVFSAIATIILLIVAIIICAVIATRMANRIGRPVRACADRLVLLAEGDLKSEIPDIKSKDETGMLAEATRSIATNLDEIISDEGYILNNMANGNFNVHTKAEERYVGDFQILLASIRRIIISLSSTMSQINLSSDQVSSGSEQVASGAQALSQGATEQASSVQELATTISEISEQIKSNAANAEDASRLSKMAGAEVIRSNDKMQELIIAMNEISNSSKEIGKVIKTIEDIAFQTNILALNAAVEAARAGEAGKGFAVVADEVRNLASKSAEAAKGTTELIEGSVKAVENGTRLVDDTAKSLDIVVSDTTEVNKKIDDIAGASSEQSQSITKVTLGVDQISSVVQTNSATAEESAAASEELSGQAQMLKELVSKFKLKEETAETVESDYTTIPSQSKPIDHDKHEQKKEKKKHLKIKEFISHDKY